MSDTIWAGTVGQEESFGSGEILGTGTVTDVDTETKIVTVDTPASEAPVEMSESEAAAMKFTQLLPFVKKLGQAMPSQKGVVRVLYALAEFPLGATKPRLLNDAERQLFQVFMEIQGAKTSVVNNIMEQNAKAHAETEALKQAAIASSNEGSAEPGAVNE